MHLHLFSFYILSVLMLATRTTRATNPIDEESCRRAGFDPWQLSCSSCDLLPESVVSKCQSCCLSYKTLKKRTHRYQAAVLVHAGFPGQYPEIDTLLQEDWENIYEKKGKRLIMKKISGGNMFQPEPSIIFWFDEVPSSSMSIDQLQVTAAETIVMDGWKRDDLRDMLLALLPDK